MDVMNINDPCKSLALTTGGGSARVAIEEKDDYISIYNPADSITYVKAGGSTVTAAATDTWIPPKTALSFKKGNTTYLAGINATENVTLRIQTGDGV